jgi:hypothetical protein
MASFPQASPPTPCAHLYPPPYAPHALPISFVLILTPALSRSFLYDALKSRIIASTALVGGYSPRLLPIDTLVSWLTPAPPFPVITIRAIVRWLVCSMMFCTGGGVNVLLEWFEGQGRDLYTNCRGSKSHAHCRSERRIFKQEFQSIYIKLYSSSQAVVKRALCSGQITVAVEFQ